MKTVGFLLGSPVVLTPEGGENVTNHFALPGDGMLRDQLYLNGTGQPTAAQAFLTSGLMPITAAMVTNGFTFSLDGSAPNWQHNGARINFYSAATASGNFVSSVTSGVTQSGDARSLTCAAASIPGTATHFATNLKWTQGVASLVYASTNVIPTDAEVSLALAVMVNSGTTGACLTDPGAPGTSESVSSAPTLATGEFLVCHQNYSTFIRREWTAGKHIVQKVSYSPEGHDYNNTYQFNSVVEIVDTVPGPLTPGAWAANASNTGANAETYAVWSDCHPAYKINDMFLGGAHGIGSSYVADAAHGKANVDRGSIWAVSSTNYMLTQRYDANNLFLTALNTGTTTEWNIAQTVLTSGTATHVSGATNTADITFTGGVLAYLFPATRQLKNNVWLEGGRALDDNGAFAAKLRIQETSYEIPNSASVLDYVATNLGSSADLNFNHSSITMQLRVALRWMDDAWSSAVFHEITALQDHHCSFSWPMQWQKINARTSQSETLHFIIPGTISCAAALTNNPGDHSNGSALDFSEWQNITTNAKEYYHDATVWAGASFWSDNTQRPAWIAAYGVKDSGGAWMRKFAMARSRIEGWTADGVPFVSHFLSGASKAYASTRCEEDVTAGDARTVVAGFGWLDPAFDTSADINFAFPLGGGRYEWNWWAATAVSAYTVPIPDALDGKQFRVVCNSAGCSVTIDNEARTITVTTTGQGEGFVAEAF